MEIREITQTQAKTGLGEMADEALKGQTVIITRKHRLPVALVALAKLEKLEDDARHYHALVTDIVKSATPESPESAPRPGDPDVDELGNIIMVDVEDSSGGEAAGGPATTAIWPNWTCRCGYQNVTHTCTHCGHVSGEPYEPSRAADEFEAKR